jgi:predicted AAA+ superfamily ATPase
MTGDTMIDRPFWRRRIEQAWREAPIAWLSGPRRVGKTTLARGLGADGVHYLNCDLPSVHAMLRDPELFFRDVRTPIVVFDEVHQLADPSRVLKIGADEFPDLRMLATGSSTLAASHKFRDTLTGRKREVHLAPVLWTELGAFDASIQRRLYHGGLPEALRSEAKQPTFYREWMDSFFARDIQRLFGFRDFARFDSLLEHVLRQSGGQLEKTRAAAALGISRVTLESHLRALEITHAVTIVRPFHRGGPQEIVRQPKVYAFDTGFVSYARSWDPLRPEDLGILWEHVVLEHLHAHLPDRRVHYWRDKAGHEVDFVIPRGRDAVDAIECKWDPAELDGRSLAAFRARHPSGANYLITPQVTPAWTRRVGGLEIRVGNPNLIPAP